MGKRKRRRNRGGRKRGEPTLFDLPLHGSNAPDAASAQVETAGAGGAPTAAAGGQDTPATAPPPERPGTATARGPSILFDADESSAGDDALDRIKLATGKTGPPDVALAVDRGESVAVPTVRRGRASAATDDEALLGDRLLGGLADLAAQLIALGLVIAATHSMDIVVTLADWMPFGVLVLVFSFLYWTVPLAFWGHTPGMTWVGHTARSSDGEPLSFGQTFLRWLGSILTLAGAGLPLLLALTGRSLTDRISGSYTTASG